MLVDLLDFKVSGQALLFRPLHQPEGGGFGPRGAPSHRKREMPGSGGLDGDTLAELQQIAGGWAHAIAGGA